MLKTKIISFSKPIDNFTTLFLDNGLASLAASILEADAVTTIEDYGRIDMIDYFKADAVLQSCIDENTSEMLDLLRKGLNPHPGQIARHKTSSDEHKRFIKTKIDEIALKDAEATFKEELDVVFFKVWNGFGTYYFKKVSEEIRRLEVLEKRRVHIYGGGPQAGWFNSHLLQIAPHADGLVLGEGEEAVQGILKLIRDQKTPDQIPGLIYRADGSIRSNAPRWITDLDSLPIAIYDPHVYLSNTEDQKVQFMMIDPSRGCPNRCYFCNHYIESGDKWRSKSASKIVDEIEWFIHRYGTRYYKYSGSSTPPMLRKEIALELIRRNIKIRYVTFMNINTVSSEEMDILKESGCFAIFFGIESGSPSILSSSIGPKNSTESIKHAVAAARNAGIYTVGSLIVPAPFDTPETIQQTLDFAIEIGVDSSPVLPPVLTGTETLWAKESERFGIEKDDDWVERMLMWDINLNYPIVLWDELPYKLNGMPFREFAQVTQRAANSLLQRGVPQMSDEMALMARVQGQKENDFLFDSNVEMRTCDSVALKKRVLNLNKRLKCASDELI